MEAPPQISSHPPQRAENGPSLGNQGGVLLVLATCLFHECREVRQSVVRMGSKVPPQARGQSGQDAQAASPESSELFSLSNHECHERRLQQRDPSLEVRSPWLSLVHELPNANPVLLRQTGSQAAVTVPLKVPNNRFFGQRGGSPPSAVRTISRASCQRLLTVRSLHPSRPAIVFWSAPKYQTR